jgi:hypothetical protein
MCSASSSSPHKSVPRQSGISAWLLLTNSQCTRLQVDLCSRHSCLAKWAGVGCSLPCCVLNGYTFIHPLLCKLRAADG